MKNNENPFAWNDAIEKLTAMPKSVSEDKGTVYINKDATIIKGALNGFVGHVIAYDSLNGIVTIKADEETQIQTVVGNIIQ